MNAGFVRKAMTFAAFGFALNVALLGMSISAAAQTALKYQSDRFAEEMRLARHYGVNMQKRGDEFRMAAENLQREDPKLTATRRGRTPGHQVVAAATETVPEKRSSFVSTVNAAEQRSKVAFNLDVPSTAS